MQRIATVGLVTALALAACAEPPGPQVPATLGAAAQQPPAQGGPGWTGLTAPEDVIEARRALMRETERLIAPIDAFTVGTPADPASLRDNARAIEALLLALPHLFPPTTNRYDPHLPEPPTTALPAIWENFDAFLALAKAAAAAAATLLDAGDEESLRAASVRLRGACDACHAAYLQPYAPPKPAAEDLEFDFDSVLPEE